MDQPAPISSRKRPFPGDVESPDELIGQNGETAKRRCPTSVENAPRPHLHLSIPDVRHPPTPPPSAAGTTTLALKLVIPQKEITRGEERKLKRRRADAERWKSKLQRPYPKSAETNKAYSLKLMRHYPDATARVGPGFQRPKIDKSPRLSHLLQRYPLMHTTDHGECGAPDAIEESAVPPDTAISLSARGKELKRARSANAELQHNIRVTGSEQAQRLAWQSFSLPDQGRVDRGREAMIMSGLDTDDLLREGNKVHNGLPGWRRPWTGHCAQGYRQA